MSRVIRELYERLSGVNLVREKVSTLTHQIDRLADTVFDHEKRLVRLETLESVRDQRTAPAALPSPREEKGS